MGRHLHNGLAGDAEHRPGANLVESGAKTLRDAGPTTGILFFSLKP
jgi:hypothetical protein